MRSTTVSFLSNFHNLKNEVQWTIPPYGRYTKATFATESSGPNYEHLALWMYHLMEAGGLRLLGWEFYWVRANRSWYRNAKRHLANWAELKRSLINFWVPGREWSQTFRRLFPQKGLKKYRRDFCFLFGKPMMTYSFWMILVRSWPKFFDKEIVKNAIFTYRDLPFCAGKLEKHCLWTVMQKIALANVA